MKKKKTKYVDDGHTIYDMSNVPSPLASTKNKDNVGLTRKEKKAAIKAALQTYMPAVLCFIGCFCVVLVLLYFWLT